MRDIAIIGMAIRAPEADDAQQFLENLRAGRDSIRELSAERRRRTSMAVDEEYQINGYLDDIDSFDHAFFGISKGEAQNMAPEHRLLLQVVYQAVENAGYDPAALKGRRASVYVGDTRLMYPQLARTMGPMMVMGTHVAATAGRIARFFGLRGPAAMVDSSCSSGLLAVHHAVNDLLLGDAELALAGGVNLNLFGEPKGETDELDLGIRSADGKTRPFSADADGTGSGEAVVAVLLKPLDQAVSDGDLIHAVIKGIAANQVAGRSSSLTAPDSAAQAEVIEQAWAKAGIDPATISYIEAHGTATQLGDPIEIEAIDLAFGHVTGQKHFCALSSVKSNIGHTWSVAGLAGLAKAVLALRYQQLFANVHAHTPSPFISFADSAVSVTRELTPWQPAAGVRRAGVSAFGMIGTNVHAVLEEAPTRPARAGTAAAEGYWFPVSAKSATALRANLDALTEWLAGHPEAGIADVQRTLVDGRGHHPYRACVTVTDMAGLTPALAAPVPAAPATAGPDGAGAANVLVVSGRCPASPRLATTFRRAHPQFDLRYAQVLQAAGDVDSPAVRQFAFQYAMCGLLRHIGLQFHTHVGEGAGRHVIDADTGAADLVTALTRAGAEYGAEAADIDARADRMLSTLTAEQPVRFIEAGPPSTVSATLAQRDGTRHTVVAAAERADAYPALLRDLYLAGADWTWAQTAGPGDRIELPSYQFDRIRCWHDEANTRTAPTAAAPAPAVTADRAADPLTSVLAAWTEVLRLDRLDLDTSFFDLGGDSVNGTQVLNRLQTVHDVELDPFAIFDHDTPRALAQYLEKEIGDRQRAGAAAPAPAGQAAETAETAEQETQPFPATAAQLSVWTAAQFERGSIAFNFTRAFEVTGPVDTVALRAALDAVAARHDGLRATFSFADEELTQRIAPRYGFSVPLEERSADGNLWGTPAAMEVVREFASRPFDLNRGPLLRAQLVTFGSGRHLLALGTHHVVVDGWSFRLIIRDLDELYASQVRGTPAALPEAGVGYREHYAGEAQRSGERRDRAAAYWLGQYADSVPALTLPVRPDATGPGFDGTCRYYSMPSQLWQRLKGFAQAEGGTVFTATLSGFAAMLSGMAEHGDLVLGTSLASRSRQSLEQLVGMQTQLLPLRLRIDGQTSFRDLYQQVRGTLGDAVRNADYPYDELVQELRRRGRTQASNLFDVLIDEQFVGPDQTALPAMAAAGVQALQVEVTPGTSVLPLDIMVAEQATLEAVIRYDTGLFDEQTIDQLWTGFTSLLDSALADPVAPLQRILRLTGSGQVAGTPRLAEPRDAAGPVGPRTDHERALAEIWQDVLGVSGIGITDRFFDLGGNSLRAIKTLARVQRRLGVKVSLDTLFAQPTIAELAAAVASASTQAEDSITSTGGPGAYPLARTQERLIEIERTWPQPAAFHRNDVFELRGHVDPALLERSFALLAQRHESLRTTYETVAGRDVQVVHSPSELPLLFAVHELPGAPADAAGEFIAARIREPFQATAQALIRADLIHTGPGAYLLVTSMNQLVADGRSAEIMQRDWEELYESLAAGRPADLPPLEIQYKDVAAWRNRRLTPERCAGHRQFWLEELSGAPSFVPVPADLPRPAVSALPGDRIRLPVPRQLAAQFAALAARHSVTEFVVARCAVGLLLAATGSTDSVIGTYTQGRDRLELEDQIGCYFNTVPLRFRLQPGDDVPSVLTRSQDEVLRAFQHQDYPYGDTLRDLGWQRGPDRSPVFDVVVGLEHLDPVPSGAMPAAGIQFVSQELPRRAKEGDLNFVFLRSTGELDLLLTYNTEIFSAKRGQAILNLLRAVVEAMAAGRPIAGILAMGELSS
jgi:acyl transferase domain-containing protein/aryl carrier-like protein